VCTSLTLIVHANCRFEMSEKSSPCAFCSDKFKTDSGRRKHYITAHKKMMIGATVFDLTDEEYNLEVDKIRDGQKHRGDEPSPKSKKSRTVSKDKDTICHKDLRKVEIQQSVGKASIVSDVLMSVAATPVTAVSGSD